MEGVKLSKTVKKLPRLALGNGLIGLRIKVFNLFIFLDCKLEKGTTKRFSQRHNQECQNNFWGKE